MVEPTEQLAFAGLAGRMTRERPETPETRELVCRHYGPVYRLLVRLTRDVHRAEDLAQETFATAWGRLAGLQEPTRVAPWLRRIAYRKFVDDCRRTRRLRAVLERAARNETRVDEVSPPGRLVRREGAQWLAGALARLGELDRAVLHARYVEDLPSARIGQLLGCGAGSIRKRLHVAIRRLRCMAGPEVGDAGEP